MENLSTPKKYSATYRSRDDIGNFKIKVRLKQVNKDEGLEETRIFTWQEKVEPKDDRLLFSYINDDLFDFEEAPVSNTKLVTKLWAHNAGTQHFPDDQEDKKVFSDDFDFMEGLIRAANNCLKAPQTFTTMHLMANLGEMVGNNRIRMERPLCELKYDCESKCLLVYPDFTQANPYLLHIETDSTRDFELYLEDASEKGDISSLAREAEVVNRINAHQLKKELIEFSEQFEMPRLDNLKIFLFCEISTGRNFEYDDVYVQYFVDLPQDEHWICRDSKTLQGSTPTCRSNCNNLFYYGFSFEICLERKLEGSLIASKNPHIYFEIVSKGSWNRFRTEGLSYVALPVDRPGFYEYVLPCLRPCGSRLDALRRFFVGDAFNYADLSWLSLPRDYDSPVLNKYAIDTVGSGEIGFRVSALHQSRDHKEAEGAAAFSRQSFASNTGGGGDFAKSIQQVVAAFKLAKRRMIEARKNV